MPIIIYIAGFRQHAGKTFTSLGLISQLRQFFKSEEIGYIKPVGQELFTLPDGRKIDKDAVIIKEFILPTLDMESVSPVRLGRGVTKKFLSSANPEEVIKDYCSSISEAIENLKDKKVIIAEGTGHPGVGGIVGLSNSTVSTMLNADIIYLAGGGIGKTLDMLEVDIKYFHSTGARVRGIIFNKLIPSKIDEMKKYITEEYLTKRFSKDGSSIKILGWIPEVKGLNKPSMRLIYKTFSESNIAGDINNPQWSIPCTGVTIVSQSHRNFQPEEHIKPGNVVILSSNSIRRLRKILTFNKTLGPDEKITGFIFTCTKTGNDLTRSMKMVKGQKVPALYVEEDTSSADEKLYKCIKNTKLQSYDKSKNRRIIDTFNNHFSIEALIDAFSIPTPDKEL